MHKYIYGHVAQAGLQAAYYITPAPAARQGAGCGPLRGPWARGIMS
ncbi:hypothetical protein [Komagataeibacter melaceti]|nr:hypothetical protein [Komagataeibacter melaceti]